MEVINNINMLTIILVGAAFIREREHGTLEHLLVMPLTPFEIMMAKIWANSLAVLLGTIVALTVIIQGVLDVPIAGSLPCSYSVPYFIYFPQLPSVFFSAHWPAQCPSSVC